jgi:hypothetical protein
LRTAFFERDVAADRDLVLGANAPSAIAAATPAAA